MIWKQEQYAEIVKDFICPVMKIQNTKPVPDKER